MRIASTEAFYPSFATGGNVATGPRASPLRTVAPWSNDEAPDPSFWTAYDYFMMEREARAMRRVYLYSALARWGRSLHALMQG